MDATEWVGGRIASPFFVEDLKPHCHRLPKKSPRKILWPHGQFPGRVLFSRSQSHRTAAAGDVQLPHSPKCQRHRAKSITGRHYHRHPILGDCQLPGPSFESALGRCRPAVTRSLLLHLLPNTPELAFQGVEGSHNIGVELGSASFLDHATRILVAERGPVVTPRRQSVVDIGKSHDAC
jgi:hypothetical protein